MAIFRHNLISTQAHHQAHTTRNSKTQCINGGLRAKCGENLSSIARLQLSLKNSRHSVTISLDNVCKRMYLERKACSSTAQWSCGVVRQKHGGSINWKSPSREGLTFRTWWRYRGARCCALYLFGPADNHSCRVLVSEMSLEGIHRTRGELMKNAPNDPDHCCRFNSSRNMIAGGAA